MLGKNMSSRRIESRPGHNHLRSCTGAGGRRTGTQVDRVVSGRLRWWRSISRSGCLSGGRVSARRWRVRCSGRRNNCLCFYRFRYSKLRLLGSAICSSTGCGTGSRPGDPSAFSLGPEKQRININKNNESRKGNGKNESTYPRLIFRGGTTDAVESPEEGVSWKD